MNGQAYVKSETHQSVTTVEFFHPLGNSLPADLLHRLAHAIHSAGNDFNTKVIVLRSGGDRAFCGGASFEELGNLSGHQQGQQFFAGFGQVINALRKCPKLVIGRIQGKCVGGGVGIAASVDYAIAAEGADIKLSELSLGFGPFVIAPAVERKIGLAAFSALAIDATMWRNADWAKRKGLYAELHASAEDMDESVGRLAFSLSHSSPEAMAELKQVLWRDTAHWDQLLSERAALSGRLAVGNFSKDAVSKLKSQRK